LKLPSDFFVFLPENQENKKKNIAALRQKKRGKKSLRQSRNEKSCFDLSICEGEKI
jgi:hypothetical protein